MKADGPRLAQSPQRRRRVGQGGCFICAEGGWWRAKKYKPRHPGPPRGSGELGEDHHSELKE